MSPRARQLLAEAGYANGFDTDFYTTVNRFPKDREISAAIVQMLNQVGIRARLQTPDFGTYFQQFSRGEYAAYYVGRGAVVDPSEYLQQYFRTGVTRRLQYSIRRSIACSPRRPRSWSRTSGSRC